MNWISINDRLPDGETENGTMVIVKLLPKEDAPRMYGDIMTGVFFRGKFHIGFKKGFVMRTVTHWMPLPEPPNQ